MHLLRFCNAYLRRSLVCVNYIPHGPGLEKAELVPGECHLRRLVLVIDHEEWCCFLWSYFLILGAIDHVIIIFMIEFDLVRQPNSSMPH